MPHRSISIDGSMLRVHAIVVSYEDIPSNPFDISDGRAIIMVSTTFSVYGESKVSCQNFETGMETNGWVQPDYWMRASNPAQPGLTCIDALDVGVLEFKVWRVLG
jgi:hypothetical protein